MALGFDLLKMAELLKCPLCSQLYCNPVSLNCLHTFCFDCLKSHVSVTRRPNGTFNCPSCAESWSVPAGGVADFLENFQVIALRNMFYPPDSPTEFPKCNLHNILNVEWYCKTCHVAVCAHCLVKDHEEHDRSPLSAVAKRFGEDLADVVTLARERLQALERLSSEFDSHRAEMEKDFDRLKACCHADALQSKVQQARNEATEYCNNLMQTMEESKEKVLTLTSSAEALYDKMHQFPFHTAVEAPDLKQQFLELQKTPVLGLSWIFKRELSDAKSVATQECLDSAKAVDITDSETVISSPEWQSSFLVKPFEATKPAYSSRQAVSGIAPMYKTMIGVSRYGSRKIWLYSRDTNQLIKTAEVSVTDEITGMVVSKKRNGVLALVDGDVDLLYLVTVSRDLEVWCQTIKTLFPADSIGRVITGNDKGALVIWKKFEKQCAVLEANGTLLRHVRFDLPDIEMDIGVSVMSSGYVVGDRANRKLYFLDGSGAVARTATTSKVPLCVLSTSWGYVLIPESETGLEIGVWTESGGYFGQIFIPSAVAPLLLYLQESERLLYVACSGEGEREIETHRFIPSDLPKYPVIVRMKTIEMSASSTAKSS